MLTKLYDSIISQNDLSIELVIVNDGSKDETGKLVQNWIEESIVKIKYFCQNNAGRGSALRKALLNAEGEYTIIMDDDDYFVEGALENIKQSIIEIDNDNSSNHNLVGICCLCLGENGEVLGDNFPDHNYISNFFSMRFLDKISGDKKEIVKTKILKENIFPFFENEKRVVTSTLWYRIAYDYDCLCLNYPVAVKRYVKGGLSDTLLTLKAESPNYQIEDCITTINFPNQFSLRITLIYSAILWKYWFFGGALSLLRIKLSRLPFVLPGLPLGLILYLKDWLKIKSLISNDT
jgi:glycosyltransferase involved in cell wall biosynthesis|tara:strand:- start:363 stop:1238 length:876 start_codon:yes stop_codon:yes gene_type:complete